MKESQPCLYELDNRIRDYPWGSTDGLNLYCGIKTQPGKPQAECWMGSHPEAPSSVILRNGERLPLSQLIASDPQAVLGNCPENGEKDLPFLFKALSAGRPLSLQVHPDSTRANLGFEREEALGILAGSPKRIYKDRHHKPELALALSPFTALCGFRPPEEALELLGRDLVSFLCPDSLREPGDYGALLERSLSLNAEERRRLQNLATLRAGKIVQSKETRVREAGESLLYFYSLYPSDPGALAAFLMRLEHFKPGQALFIPAGLMHAYVEGTILEIMASSDNVVRGGLSPKHIDVDELLKVIDFSAQPVFMEEGMPAAHQARKIWKCPVQEFSLERIQAGGEKEIRLKAQSAEILLCTEGGFSIHATGSSGSRSMSAAGAVVGAGAGGKELALARGSSAFLGASCGFYSLQGSGTVYRARVPCAEGAVS